MINLWLLLKLYYNAWCNALLQGQSDRIRLPQINPRPNQETRQFSHYCNGRSGGLNFQDCCYPSLGSFKAYFTSFFLRFSQSTFQHFIFQFYCGVNWKRLVLINAISIRHKLLQSEKIPLQLQIGSHEATESQTQLMNLK